MGSDAGWALSYNNDRLKKSLKNHNVINLRKNNNPGHLFMLFKQKDIWDYCIFIQQNQS